MNVYESPAVSEVRVARDVVSRHLLPDDVASIDIELGEDHDNEPAMWLVFTLRANIDGDADSFLRIHSFAQQVRPELLKAGVERFPYVRIQQAPVQ